MGTMKPLQPEGLSREATLRREKIQWIVLLSAALLSAAILAENHLRRAGITNGALDKVAASSEANGGAIDPASYLNERSPGQRGSGALVQTKNRLTISRSKALTPRERVLANVRYGPPSLAGPPASLPYLNDVVPFGSPSPGLTNAGFAPNPASPPTFSFPVGVVAGGGTANSGSSGGGGKGGGGSNGGSTGGGGGTTSPVPEPATWAMLFLGMFSTGVVLRITRFRMKRRSAAIDDC